MADLTPIVVPVAMLARILHDGAGLSPERTIRLREVRKERATTSDRERE